MVIREMAYYCYTRSRPKAYPLVDLCQLKFGSLFQTCNGNPRVFVFDSPIWLCCIPQTGGADFFGGPSVIAYYPDLSIFTLLVDHLNSNCKGLVIILDYCTYLCAEKLPKRSS